MNLLTATVVGIVLGAGVHLMLRRDAVRIAAGTLLITNSAVLLLVSASFGAPKVPILPLERIEEVADPLVQALALTAIVIGFATTVLLLRVTRALEQTHDSIDVQELVDAETSEQWGAKGARKGGSDGERARGEPQS